LKWVLVVISGYLLGSISFGIIVSRQLAGVDIRTLGSGNTGMTNVWRSLGKGPGMLVFVGDCMKGVLPVALGLAWGGDNLGVAGGLAAMLGHSYPLYFGFRGGRGVATAFGVLLALTPWVALSAIAVFFVVLCLGRRVSLASMVGITAAVVLAVLMNQSTSVFMLVLVFAVFIFYRHIPNIQRLLNGTEPMIDFKKFNKKE
jgi:glycerol-3-phosphate acyltransferase PlsY